MIIYVPHHDTMFSVGSSEMIPQITIKNEERQ